MISRGRMHKLTSSPMVGRGCDFILIDLAFVLLLEIETCSSFVHLKCLIDFAAIKASLHHSREIIMIYLYIIYIYIIER